MEISQRIRSYFDELGEGEWLRLTSSPRALVSLEVHRRMLAEHVRAGARVLEVGAGAGRFTIELARLGAVVTVTDLSPVQLDLNEQHVREAGYEQSVEARYLLDVRDTSRYLDNQFDVVLVYGGPLSYIFEDAQSALRDCLRVGSIVLASVMCTLGAWRLYLPQIIELAKELGDEVNDLIVHTGDLRHEGTTSGHTCQMYRSREVERLVHDAGGRLLTISASNWASFGDETALEEIHADPDRWLKFLALEVAACREPGLLDAGSHIVFAASSRT